MPELFGQERHERMDHGQSPLEGGVKRVLSRYLLFRCAIGYQELRIFNIYIAEMGVPELICGSGGSLKFTFCQRYVDLFGCHREFMQNPSLSEGFFACFFGCRERNKIIVELAQNVFSGLINFVAKSPVAMNNLDIKIDITTYLMSTLKF